MSKPSIITYVFKDLEEIAKHFEEKAKQAERIANGAGPQIKLRLNHEAAAYYDIVNILRNARIEKGV